MINHPFSKCGVETQLSSNYGYLVVDAKTSGQMTEACMEYDAMDYGSDNIDGSDIRLPYRKRAASLYSR